MPKYEEHDGSLRLAPSKLEVCLMGKEWTKAMKRLGSKKGKKEAAILNEKSELPIHIACWKNAPPHVVFELIQANPTATKQVNHCGGLPVHESCFGKADADVIRMLLIANPEGASVGTIEHGSLPIHIACANETPVLSVIEQLLEAFPEGVSLPDSCGRLPLHYAAIHRAPMDIIMCLLKADCGASRREDDYGLVPAFYARAYGSSPDAIRTLTVVAEGQSLRDVERDGTSAFSIDTSNWLQLDAPFLHVFFAPPSSINRNTVIKQRIESTSTCDSMSTFSESTDLSA